MRAVLAFCGVIAWGLCGPASASELDLEYDPLALDREAYAEEYAAGVRKHDLDGTTRLVGWRINDRWYFGRRKGDADGIGFVWQKGETQISLTPEGIGWRRQFSIH